jgi:RNA polymerase sigma-70 factor (ECF subfamily)
MYSTSFTLLERVRQPGDRAAWDRLVALYTPFLYHCGLRLGLSEADTADAVQDVFLVLLDKLPKFQYQSSGSFRAWLRTVTCNKIRERFRKRRETAVGGSDPAFDDPLDPAEPDDLWNAEYNQYLAKRALEIMQAEFEPATWQAVWLTTVEGRRTADVAAELGITSNAVFVARSRVLRRLREELAGLLDD